MKGPQDYEHRWSRTPYPKRCPECGDATSVRRPGLGCRTVIWVSAYAALFIVRAWLDTWKFRDAGALGPALVGLAVLAVLYREYRRGGGEQIRRFGFVICPGCGWRRVGEEDGIAVRDRHLKALAVFRAAMVMLAAPLAFFGALVLLTRRPDAGTWATSLFWAFALAAMMWGIFRPEQVAPPSKRRPPDP